MKQDVEGLTITVRGRTFPVRVESNGEDTGSFIVDVDGSEKRFDQWAGMHSWLSDAVRKSTPKFDIPVTVVDGDRVRNGTVYAVHAGTDRPMVRWDDGGTEQLGGRFGGQIVLRRLTRDASAEYTRLRQAVVDALAERKVFEEAHNIDLKSAIESEMNSAAVS